MDWLHPWLWMIWAVLSAATFVIADTDNRAEWSDQASELTESVDIDKAILRVAEAANGSS